MTTTTKFIISKTAAALGIAAIPVAYIGICVALHVHVGLWAWLLLVTMTIFLPVLIFQFRNYKKFKGYVEQLQKEEKGLKQEE